MLRSLIISVAALLSAKALANVVAQEGDECRALYKPDNLDPTVMEYINFLTAPLSMGNGAGQYNWFENLQGGIVSDNGLFNGTTDSPVDITSNAIWPVPASGEIQLAAVFNFTSSLLSGDISSPLGISEDPFYGAGWFGVDDIVDGWQFAIIMTQNKVYAWYSRYATEVSVAGNFKLFSYLIPYWNRVPTDSTTKYSIVLNPARFTASWRVDGEEKVLIQNTGKPIDQRFLVSCTLGFNEGPSFPRNIQLVMGVLPLTIFSSGSPHTACQRTVFNECTQSPYNAYLTFCQYAPIQNQAVTDYDIQLLAQFSEWSLVHWDFNDDCHRLNNPCQTPDLYCPGENENRICQCEDSEAPCVLPSSEESSHHCPIRTPCCGRKPGKPRRRHH